MSALMLYRLDGAYSQVGQDETAFSGGRSPRYAAFIIGLAPNAGLLATERRWARGFWEALNTQAIDGGGGYINGSSEYSGSGVRRSYGPARYERLTRIKAEYDPGNMFHLNAANIAPAGTG